MAFVAGVVVTYEPDSGSLERLLLSLGGQIDCLIVVDNGSGVNLDQILKSIDLPLAPIFIPLKTNLGIGAAQNAGIRTATELGATHVALFDQDSVLRNEMIPKLLAGEEDLLNLGVKVGAVGPVLVDERSGQPIRFVQFSAGIKRRTDPRKVRERWIETHHLVASGTLFRVSTLKHVGLMREELFLEYVDVEWGLRALAQGYRSFGIVGAEMLHNLGDSRATLPFGLASVPLHSPLRHYYTMRNAVWMQRAPYVPLRWKLHDAIRTALGFLYFGLFSPPRGQQVAMMTRGLSDGWRRRMGKLEEAK